MSEIDVLRYADYLEEQGDIRYLHYRNILSTLNCDSSYSDITDLPDGHGVGYGDADGDGGFYGSGHGDGYFYYGDGNGNGYGSGYDGTYHQCNTYITLPFRTKS